MCSHKFKLIRHSATLYKGKLTYIEIYQCEKCEKFMILNENGSRISLNGELGLEVENLN